MSDIVSDGVIELGRNAPQPAAAGPVDPAAGRGDGVAAVLGIVLFSALLMAGLGIANDKVVADPTVHCSHHPDHSHDI